MAHQSFGNVSVMQQNPVHWFSKRKAKLQMNEKLYIGAFLSTDNDKNNEFILKGCLMLYKKV
jgi:hypothetical protein